MKNNKTNPIKHTTMAANSHLFNLMNSGNEPLEKILTIQRRKKSSKMSFDSKCLGLSNDNRKINENLNIEKKPENGKNSSSHLISLNHANQLEQAQVNSNNPPILNVDNSESAGMSSITNSEASQDNIFFIKDLNEMDEYLIKQTLKKHFMFASEDIIILILDDLIEIKIRKGKVLYEINDEGEYFYIVKSGLLESSTKSDMYYKPWDCLGDLSLIQDVKRTETVWAVENSEVYVLDSAVFRQIISKINERKMKERLDHLNIVPLFQSLNNAEKLNIVNLLKIEEYHPREIIINQGDIGSSMFIIKEGCVSCRYKNSEVRILYEKEFFGENSILFDSILRTMNIISLNKTTCYVITKEVLIEALGHNYKKHILFGIFMSFISKSKFFSESVESTNLHNLFNNFKLFSYRHGDIVYNLQTDKKKIIFVIEGNLVRLDSVRIF